MPGDVGENVKIREMLREMAGSHFDEWYSRGDSTRIEDALDAIPELE